MALPLCGIRARCGGTPRGGSGRTSYLRPLPPPVFLTPSSHNVQVYHSTSPPPFPSAPPAAPPPILFLLLFSPPPPPPPPTRHAAACMASKPAATSMSCYLVDKHPFTITGTKIKGFHTVGKYDFTRPGILMMAQTHVCVTLDLLLLLLAPPPPTSPPNSPPPLPPQTLYSC
ncbi:unnamed protein product [Schistocephalus solidus]|uniref:Uncharacterized protein n=1 Tax=Schistocephalus solidus TaxID=70667 RepID=A0A183SPK0_SCHSO|nr:unnamed protein product [Schistocephalus solidus]